MRPVDRPQTSSSLGARSEGAPGAGSEEAADLDRQEDRSSRDLVFKAGLPPADIAHMAIGAAGGSFLFGLVIIFGLYFLPTIIGKVRGVPNLGSIAVINFFLGVTLVGWVVALAMAARTVPRAQRST
jgi:Superinfection immunity protein